MMILMNRQQFPSGLQLGKLHLRLEPFGKDGCERTLTSEEEALLKKFYTVADLAKYGFTLNESSSTPADKDSIALASPKSGEGDASSHIDEGSGTQAKPEPIDEGKAPSTMSLREIQNRIREGLMTKAEAEAMLEAEVASEMPRQSVLKELKKVLR